MQASTSTERTPLVQPTYVFESSLHRSYKKRLRNFQCVICIIFLAILIISLLVTVSYKLSDDSTPEDNSTVNTPPVPLPIVVPSLQPSQNLTLPLVYQPMLKKSWPLKPRPLPPWGGGKPSQKDITDAVTRGKEALKNLQDIESKRKPLDQDSPANRAQRAAATAPGVKPLADAAYTAEEATRALLNGTDMSKRDGGAGVGPPIYGTVSAPSYCGPSPPCPPSKYRSFNGSCNNLEHPLLWGVTNTPLRRVLPASYGDGISSPRTGVNGTALPSARDVSVTVHRPSYAHDSTFTVMLAVWGQFMDHDITATALSKGQNSSALSCCDPGPPSHPECFPVKLDVEDPFYEAYNLTCMEFVRSAPAPTCHFGPREQMNQATAFIDGSIVYGYHSARTDRLRLGAGGKLKMLTVGTRELLPQSTNPDDGCNTAEMNAKGRYCFDTGDDRANENLHLTTMHLLWARWHNRLVALLADQNPAWDDEKLFQEARRILGAQMQHITYTEFLPAILGEDTMYALNLTVLETGQSHAYDPTVDPSIANHFASSVFRFAHTLLPGLIHSVDSNTGAVSYTQLHQMLFNPFTLYLDEGSKEAIASAMDNLVHTVQPHVSAELSNHLFERPVVMNSSAGVTHAGPCGLDLVSLNIQRGRDHGLPGYPAWRELCGFPRPKNFSDLATVFDDLSMSRISMIYKSVDEIDLYTGALAEEPHGRLLGPTLSCLISDQFLRLKIGDRFWYETADESVGFTIEQLTEIRKTSLAGVICATEERLGQAQPRVMRAVGPTNPLVTCTDLPQPDLSAWRELPDADTPQKR